MIIVHHRKADRYIDLDLLQRWREIQYHKDLDQQYVFDICCIFTTDYVILTTAYNSYEAAAEAACLLKNASAVSRSNLEDSIAIATRDLDTFHKILATGGLIK